MPVRAVKASQRREHLNWVSSRGLGSGSKIKWCCSYIFHSGVLTLGVLLTKNSAIGKDVEKKAYL